MPTLLLTGAAGNLGLFVTDYFLSKGWHVHAACRTDIDAERLPVHSHLSSSIRNLSEESEVEVLFIEAGDIHAVVHLVGGIEAGISFSETPIGVFESMIQLNTRTTFLVIRQALRSLQSGGSIVTIGAKAALLPVENKSCYAAAKAASISLTMTAAEEGKSKNIRANVIVPGIIRTAANLEWASNGEENSWTLPVDIASAIYLLCSDNSKGISGAVIPMYGKLPT
ncbi:MAG: SDR family oxidoreductase [Ignavibacteria bacterium]|nr:SDR family oxidoreductase [Ignavibacteria bacterium]